MKKVNSKETLNIKKILLDIGKELVINKNLTEKEKKVLREIKEKINEYRDLVS